MKNLLLPFHDADGAEVTADTACRLARRFSSHVEALFIPESLGMFLRSTGTQPAAMQPELVTQLTQEWRAITSRAQQRFMRVTSRYDIPLMPVDGSSDSPSASWSETEGREAEVISGYGRLFDLIILDRVANDWQATCEAALFETGRPVFITPKVVPQTIGDKVIIAWNYSTETARTIGLGMPLLSGATSVMVLEVEGWTFPGPSGEALAQRLRRSGIAATARTAKPKGRSNGKTILDEAAALDADLLVKGAYTQTRFRQMIFGSATRHVLTEATLPLLMAH